MIDEDDKKQHVVVCLKAWENCFSNNGCSFML